MLFRSDILEVMSENDPLDFIPSIHVVSVFVSEERAQDGLMASQKHSIEKIDNDGNVIDDEV